MRYFFREGRTLKQVEGCSSVPVEVEDFCKIDEAIAYLQWLGCAGKSQHKINSDFHLLCLDVLKWVVASEGEYFPCVYRGVRSDRPDQEYKVLFGSSDVEVAKFYGEIKVYKNVRGIKVKSSRAKSVISDDWSIVDDEIIFFPEEI